MLVKDTIGNFKNVLTGKDEHMYVFLNIMALNLTSLTELL